MSTLYADQRRTREGRRFQRQEVPEMATYGIDDGKGKVLAEGLGDESAARDVARMAANMRDASVWLYCEGDPSPAEEVKPAPTATRRPNLPHPDVAAYEADVYKAKRDRRVAKRMALGGIRGGRAREKTSSDA